MNAQPPFVLVVDDEPDICANLQDILSDLGYRVDVAQDGFQALKLVEQNAYDVALLDLKMPGMDGLELYCRIKQLRADTVAIIITAYATSETAKAAMQDGAWQVMSKPIDFSRLLAIVTEASHQPLVMIVDDDCDLCSSLWDVLHEEGFRVGLAHDVDEAAKQLDEREYSLVLIDMKLPQGDGRDVFRLVRQRTIDARTILITTQGGETELIAEELLKAGADAVCFKPFNVARLISSIKELAK